ncbi:hypothetical protein CHS0354_017145 [Potamilus streckersoni]|uniref:Uncharacterized protein n=1 Tax=Potamilus streckersoni TaxID=2493646 RepID=A0AAE0T397_9BIVA|nr:hypothetical protein CHS0354_017145 [Potamilus streckersoni]
MAGLLTPSGLGGIDFSRSQPRLSGFQRVQKVRISTDRFILIRSADRSTQPIEAEAPAHSEVKENEDFTACIKTHVNVVSTERSPTPPIVYETVVSSLDISIDDMASSGASVAVKTEKYETQRLKYKEGGMIKIL